jgi:hypothetical protein
VTVSRVTIARREPFAGGRGFGSAGAYEVIDGTLEYAFDAAHPANATIVDLAHAERQADGRVHARGRFSLLRPAHGNGRVLLDVPNRGRRIALTQFNRVPRADAQASPLSPGDGFLFERGYTLATIGWQFDVLPEEGFWFQAPQALVDGRPPRGEVICQVRADRNTDTLAIGRGGRVTYAPGDLAQPAARLTEREWEDGPEVSIPRTQWRFARHSPNGVQASNSHIFRERGFLAGRIYSLVYETAQAPVVGLGLLALRDAATWLRGGAGGLLAGCDWIYGFGASQTGRVLREMLHDGLNRDEAGSVAFDALLVHIAGAQRGDFNHRHAQPGALWTPGFGQAFPFALPCTSDPLGGRKAGLLDRCRADGSVPKVFITNTAYEYWRGDASLAHVGTDGRDLVPAPEERIYALAGSQHTVGRLPLDNRDADLGTHTRYAFCVVDHSPLLRAALANLDAWASRGIEPPPSRHPRLADGSAVPRATVLAQFAAVFARDSFLDPATLPVLRVILADRDQLHGVTTQPVPEGEPYPCLVSAVDADLNETAGIRLPDISVPVGTHTGWNPRHGRTGATTQAATFMGMTRMFAATEALRARAKDPRPALETRYLGRDDYLARARTAASLLVADGYLLADDVELVVANCAARYDAARQNDGW